MASTEYAPSLITTPQLRCLWNDVQANPGKEYLVMKFWAYLLKEVLGFSGPNWSISTEQPPTGGPEDRERVDLQIDYFDPKLQEFRVVLFLEGKAHGAGLAQYDIVEHQAYRDCIGYMERHKLKKFHAVTVVGTTARVWSCDDISHYLNPLSTDESLVLSDVKAYIETNSTDGAILRQQFALVKEVATSESSRIRQQPLPPSILPSQQ